MSDGLPSVARLVWIGVGAFAVAVVADLALEWNRAQSALGDWICDKNLPLPAGAGVCASAFVAHWFIARLPFYTAIIALVLLLWYAAAVGLRAMRSPPTRSALGSALMRYVVLAIALLALAELMACTSEAACSLSATCK